MPTLFSAWLPQEVHRILARFREPRFTLYLVGGGVIQFLEGKPAGELDFVCEGATPQDLASLGGVPIGGPVDAHLFRGKNMELEITPIPAGGLKADLMRRDFTIHAMAVEVQRGVLIDPRRGWFALRERLLICHDVSPDPLELDPLRVLRGFRRLAEGFSLHPLTAARMFKLAPRLASVPPERIGREMLKLLVAERAGECLRLFKEYPPLLHALDPVFARMAHSPPPPGHRWDPFTHSTYLLERLPPEPALRLAALLHDAGKIHPYPGEEGHASKSARFAEELLERWAIPRTIKKEVVELIARHTFSSRELLEDQGKLRRFYALNRAHLPRLLLFRRWDRYAAGGGKGYDDLKALGEALVALEGETFPLSPAQLPLHREELLKMLGIPPKKRKQFLEALWGWVLEDPATRNDPERILEYARMVAKKDDFEDNKSL